jgi:hypothetical protein
MNRHEPGAAFDWDQGFDDTGKTAMTSTPAEMLRIKAHQDFDLAVPTPDHFIPFLYRAGLASAAGRPSCSSKATQWGRYQGLRICSTPLVICAQQVPEEHRLSMVYRPQMRQHDARPCEPKIGPGGKQQCRSYPRSRDSRNPYLIIFYFSRRLGKDDLRSVDCV